MVEKSQERRSGLTAITIENFKGIGAPVTVPLKPITLLFGANSAGKSTVLHALLYAREVLEHGNADVDRTTLGGDSVNLGGFRALVHKHELDRRIAITLHYEGMLQVDKYLPAGQGTLAFGYMFSEDRGYDLDVNVWLDIHSFDVKIETGWDMRDGKAFVAAYDVSINGEFLGRIQKESSSEYAPPRVVVSPFHPLMISPDPKREVYLCTILDELWDRFVNIRGIESLVLPRLNAERQQQVRENPVYFALNNVPSNSSPEQLEKFPKAMLGDTMPQWGRTLLLHWEDGDKSPSAREEIHELNLVLTQMLVAPGDTVREVLQDMRYLGPLREIPFRGYTPPKRPDESRWSTGLGAWDLLLRERVDNEANIPSDTARLVARCNEYLTAVLGLGYSVRRADRIQLDADGPIMNALRLLGTTYEDRDEDFFRHYVLEPLESLPQLATIALHDEKSGIDVDPQDVGVGVSQTLPVVVGALDPHCSLFAVEQPELHVHPAVQVNLADVFLREVLEDGKKPRVFLLETHSEHIVLRIMRRMRQTCEDQLPASFPQVKPGDVAVLYVQIVDNRTCVREMPLNERGELVKAWPGGFFEEALRETF